jgi:GNAT superfamily N-acetyltransferase
MIDLRPFSDHDYPALAELHHAVWGEPRTAAELRSDDDEDFFPAGYFVALDTASGALVGTTHISPRPADPRQWEFDLTGVVRSHRRRGIALTLKLRAIALAAQNGAELLVTDNEENNPMYQINLQLGFTYA